MKKWKKVFVSLFTICMLLCMMSINVMAAPNPNGVYRVRLLTGDQGSFGGSTEKPYDVSYGQAVDMTNEINAIQTTDDRYYVKGVRISGHDNSDYTDFSLAKFNVYSDIDYVVTYGISANRVAYTVNYQDANGNELAPSNTYYGDVGDRPVVAYQYIENYIPQALAMTGTLSSNAADNVFTFVYAPGASDSIITNTTVVNAPGGTDATAAPAAATPAAATPATPADAATATANAAAADASAGGGATVTNADEDTPQALVDTDEETPTANIDATSEGSKTPFVVAIVVGVLAVAALVAGFVLYRKRRIIK